MSRLNPDSASRFIASLLCLAFLSACTDSGDHSRRSKLLAELNNKIPQRPVPYVEFEFSSHRGVVVRAEITLVRDARRVSSQAVWPDIHAWRSGFDALSMNMKALWPLIESNRESWLEHMDDFSSKLRLYGAIEERGHFVSFALPLGWPIRSFGPWSSYERLDAYDLRTGLRAMSVDRAEDMQQEARIWLPVDDLGKLDLLFGTKSIAVTSQSMLDQYVATWVRMFPDLVQLLPILSRCR